MKSSSRSMTASPRSGSTGRSGSMPSPIPCSTTGPRRSKNYKRDDRVRAVVLTGTGRGFCSGGDVRAMGERHRHRRDRVPAQDRRTRAHPPHPAPARGFRQALYRRDQRRRHRRRARHGADGRHPLRRRERAHGRDLYQGRARLRRRRRLVPAAARRRAAGARNAVDRRFHRRASRPSASASSTRFCPTTS